MVGTFHRNGEKGIDHFIFLGFRVRLEDVGAVFC